MPLAAPDRRMRVRGRVIDEEREVERCRDGEVEGTQKREERGLLRLQWWCGYGLRHISETNHNLPRMSFQPG